MQYASTCSCPVFSGNASSYVNFMFTLLRKYHVILHSNTVIFTFSVHFHAQEFPLLCIYILAAFCFLNNRHCNLCEVVANLHFSND